MILILILLTIFSIIWFFIWLWFFKYGKTEKDVGILGLKAFKRKNYRKAKELLLQAPSINTNIELRMRLAISHFELSEYKEAKEIFESLLQNEPYHKKVIWYLAKIAEKENDTDKALEYYTQIIEKEPACADTMLKTAWLLYRKDSYDDVTEKINEIKKLDTKNKDIENECNILNLICQSNTCDIDDRYEYRKLMEEFKKNEKYGKKYSEFNLSYAKLFATSGNIKQAFEYCAKAIAINSENIEAYQLLGLIQLVKKNFSDAKNSLNVALTMDSQDQITHNLFSYVLCSQVKTCALSQCRETYFKLVSKNKKSKN